MHPTIPTPQLTSMPAMPVSAAATLEASMAGVCVAGVAAHRQRMPMAVPTAGVRAGSAGAFQFDTFYSAGLPCGGSVPSESPRANT